MMVDKFKKCKYNEYVKVIYEAGRTIYKLYRDGKLVYIGVMNDAK
jgi:hypothetical protein